MSDPHPIVSRLVAACLAHRARVVLVWVGLLAAALPLALQLPQRVQGGADPIPGSETGAVIRAITAAFGHGAYEPIPVVVRHPRRTVADPDFTGGVQAIARALGQVRGVRRVETAWTSRSPLLIGRDRHSTLLVVTTSATSYAAAEEMVDALRHGLEGRTPSGFEVHVTGTTAVLHDVDRRASSDLAAAERVGLPITLMILLLVFRSPVAALVPVLLAMLAVTVCNAVLVLCARAMPVSVFAENVATMIGLGAGIDYALFVVSRWRSERPNGGTAADVVRRAVSATGPAVLFSAVAVAVGFLALLLVDAPFLRAITVGGVCVVAVAALAAVTLLPVILVTVGPALTWPGGVVVARTAAVGATRAGTPVAGPWAAWARWVMRRPIAAAVALVVVIGFALPALELRGWNVGVEQLAPDDDARRGADLLRNQFASGWMGPTVLLVQADRGSLLTADRVAALTGIAAEAARDPRVAAVTGLPEVLRGWSAAAAAAQPTLRAAVSASGVLSPDGRTGVIAIIGRDEPSTRPAGALVRDLRARGFERAARTGIAVRVGGPAAGFVDFDRTLFDRMPLVIGVVLALTFVVLALSFRSVVLPLKAIVLNLLSVLAAFGFLVSVFQHGALHRVLGVPPTGGLNAFVVLMLFTILFGLSMDYEVFVLSRVREGWRRTGDTRRAVEIGIAGTAGVITSAALIMISIFAAFGFTRLAATRQFGLGLAFAVALDATLLRMVLVPALVALAGRANWWWPLPSRGPAADQDVRVAVAPARHAERGG